MDYSLVRESIRLRVESNNEKAKTALIKQPDFPLALSPSSALVPARFRGQQESAIISKAMNQQPKPLGPVLTAHLLPKIERMLIELLRSLAPNE